MNLNMIRTENEIQDLLLSITKLVKSWLSKLIENRKKPSNLKCSNQEKHFILIHQFTSKETG